jgi:hypothetical protein
MTEENDKKTSLVSAYEAAAAVTDKATAATGAWTTAVANAARSEGAATESTNALSAGVAGYPIRSDPHDAA